MVNGGQSNTSHSVSSFWFSFADRIECVGVSSNYFFTGPNTRTHLLDVFVCLNFAPLFSSQKIQLVGLGSGTSGHGIHTLYIFLDESWPHSIHKIDLKCKT